MVDGDQDRRLSPGVDEGSIHVAAEEEAKARPQAEQCRSRMYIINVRSKVVGK